MRVGVPKEVKSDEYRVGMMPVGAEALTRAGHEVFIETHAGVASGFTDDDYQAAGAKKLIGNVRVPLLLITAQDDPFVSYGSIRASGVEENPHATFEAPTHGGHCGFISGRSGPERFWAETRIVDFCESRAARTVTGRA